MQSSWPGPSTAGARYSLGCSERRSPWFPEALRLCPPGNWGTGAPDQGATCYSPDRRPRSARSGFATQSGRPLWLLTGLWKCRITKKKQFSTFVRSRDKWYKILYFISPSSPKKLSMNPVVMYRYHPQTLYRVDMVSHSVMGKKDLPNSWPLCFTKSSIFSMVFRPPNEYLTSIWIPDK